MDLYKAKKNSGRVNARHNAHYKCTLKEYNVRCVVVTQSRNKIRTSGIGSSTLCTPDGRALQFIPVLRPAQAYFWLVVVADTGNLTNYSYRFRQALQRNIA